jgi:hypothetical protein
MGQRKRKRVQIWKSERGRCEERRGGRGQGRGEGVMGERGGRGGRKEAVQRPNFD